jgi:hypothetical protein
MRWLSRLLLLPLLPLLPMMVEARHHTSCLASGT